MSHVQHATDWRNAEELGQPPPLRSWRTPRQAVGAIFLLNGGLFGAWASRIPFFVEHLRISPNQLGLLLLCMAVGAIASFPIAGKLSDRCGASVMSRRFAVLYVIAFCIVGLAPSALALAICLVLFGAMQGALDVTMNAWGAEVERCLAQPIMSSLHAMFSLGAALGALTGYLAGHHELGTGPHFISVGLGLGVGSLLLASAPWPPVSAPEDRCGGFVRPHRRLLLVGLVASCATLSEGALADWSGIFLYTVTHVSEAQSALGYAAFSAAMVAMRLIGDRTIRRWGPSLSARVSGILAAGGVLLAISSQHLHVALIGFILMGVGYANIAPLAFSRAASDPSVPAGAAIAGVATFGYGGLLVGPPLIGWISEGSSLVFGFSLLAGLSLLISLFAGHLDTPKTIQEKVQ